MRDLTPVALDFGGSNSYAGVSTSRTLMVRELSALLAATPRDATKTDYKTAVVDQNLLLKPSTGTRAKTYAYLRDRFALDPAVPLFKTLRLLWDRDSAGQPLIALLVAAFRDPLLRATLPAVIAAPPDQRLTSREFALVVGRAFPDRLNAKTLQATAERLVSTYKQSGHLEGRSRCRRRRVRATPGSATIALLLATLDGGGGRALLATDWVRLLDSPDEVLLAEARVAASRGWLEYRHAGDVLEITFRQLFAAIGVRG